MLILLTALLAVTVQGGAGPGEAPIRIDRTMPQPQRLRVSQPKYPEEAQKVGLQGIVLVEAAVDIQGRITDATAIRGDQPLSDAAVSAVKKWRYEPLMVEGKRKPFVVTVQVNFASRAQVLKVSDFFEALSSKYEAVREAAVTWLGALKPGPPGHRSPDFPRAILSAHASNGSAP